MVFGSVGLALDRITRPFGLAEYPPAESPVRRRAGNVAFWGMVDRIGLDGFESAYPKELSGGMQRRVGFARALGGEARRPADGRALLALDVLTGETKSTKGVGWPEHLPQLLARDPELAGRASSRQRT